MPLRLAVEVQRLAGQREVRLADDFRLGGVRVDQPRHLGWDRLPVGDQLAFGDELADPCSDQVDTEHWPGLGIAACGGGGDDLGRAVGPQDHASAVRTKRVVDFDGPEPARGRDRGGDSYRGDLRIAVSDSGHAGSKTPDPWRSPTPSRF
jgi:hypothetical protein